MIAPSRSLTSTTRDLNTTSNALRLSRTSSSELLSATGLCATSEKQRSKIKRMGLTAFITCRALHHLRRALGRMRQKRPLVIILNFRQTKAHESLVRQRDVVVAFSRMAHQQALLLFQIFKSTNDVGVGIGGRAIKEFAGQNARLPSLLEKVDHVALNLFQPMPFHCSPSMSRSVCPGEDDALIMR